MFIRIEDEWTQVYAESQAFNYLPTELPYPPLKKNNLYEAMLER